MPKTIVALFDEISVARQVVEDLVKAEFARDSISLITNDAQNQYSRYLEKDYVPREDAVTSAEGAGFGAIVGALTGVLLGLVALTIPGFGLAVVAGPLVAGLTGAVAGALTGGIVGALIKTGVPEDQAPYYAEAIKRGATLISIDTDEIQHAEEILHRYGSINIHERINHWREAGWQGFANEPAIKEEDTEPWEIMTTTTKETTSTKLSPFVSPTTPDLLEPVHPMPVSAEPQIIAAQPLEVVTINPVLAAEEPPINMEDTTPSLPLFIPEPELVPPNGTEAPAVNHEVELDNTADWNEFPALEVVKVQTKE